MPDESKAEAPLSTVVLYANAYLTDRLYGGPEEGGWWYDTGEPIMSLPFTANENEFTWDKLARNLATEQVYDLCVAAGQDVPDREYVQDRDWCIDGFSIFIESKPGEYFPKKRPHWDMGEDY